ncbi:molybdenum cofactor guanylyltransferase [Consotaella aegiceratis]|uniref:molybdenum cofactor guanylyltransferase n=1 Tax=Consotaella aegiceratis TaxID=3097961 RepID=UPI002F3FB292
MLAGGRGSRMGGTTPKPLISLAGRPLIAYVLDRLAPVLKPVLVGTHPDRGFEALNLPLVPDRLAGFAGPLAGLDAAVAWLRENEPKVSGLICTPGDTPFLPFDLVERMLDGPRDEVRSARFSGLLQPSVTYWPLARLDDLAAYLEETPDRSIRSFLARSGVQPVDFLPSDHAPHGDSFFNVNTHEDLAKATAFLAG